MRMLGPELSEVMELGLSWHPAFNVYIVGCNDVLLISASRQFLLSAEAFPGFYLIDGVRTSDDIVKSYYDGFRARHSALFYYQLNQLKNESLLVEGDFSDTYLQPIIDEKSCARTIRPRSLSGWCSLINLSVLPEFSLASLESMLRQFVASIEDEKFIDRGLSLVLVDDFTDPKVLDVDVDLYFMVINFSGDKIWVSPVFQRTEMNIFSLLQRRILQNQPVRRALMARWPDRSHSYCFFG